MKHIIYILAILAVGVWSYLAGTIMPAVVQRPSVMQFLEQHDTGCGDIVRDSSGQLVCEVTLESEDEQIYIVRL